MGAENRGKFGPQERREIPGSANALGARLVLAQHFLSQGDHQEVKNVLIAHKPISSIPANINFDSSFIFDGIIRSLSKQERKRNQGAPFTEEFSEYTNRFAKEIQGVQTNSERAQFLRDVFQIESTGFDEEEASQFLRIDGVFFSRNILTGEKESNISGFINYLFNSPRYRPEDMSVNLETIESDKEHIIWLGNIYGPQTARIIFEKFKYAAKMSNVMRNATSAYDEGRYPTSAELSIISDRENETLLSDANSQLPDEFDRLLRNAAEAYVNEYNSETQLGKDVREALRWAADDDVIAGQLNQRCARQTPTGNQWESDIIQLAKEYRRQMDEIESYYSRELPSDDPTPVKNIQWEKQQNIVRPEGTCAYAAIGNALRSLNIFNPNTNSEEALHSLFLQYGGPWQKALKEKLPTTAPVTVIQSANILEIIQAVEQGASAMVDIDIIHAGTIPAGSKVYRKDNTLMIRVIDPAVGVIELPIRKLVRGSSTYFSSIGEKELSSNFILKQV